jgi:hypothetical protein
VGGIALVDPAFSLVDPAFLWTVSISISFQNISMLAHGCHRRGFQVVHHQRLYMRFEQADKHVERGLTFSAMRIQRRHD